MCAIKDVKLLILDFFQKGLDEIFFNGWILIPACEDCTKLKRNLQLSKNRPGGSQGMKERKTLTFVHCLFFGLTFVPIQSMDKTRRINFADHC